MCLNPILIENPNVGCSSAVSFMKDTVSKFIPIPCGHCPECLATRHLGLVQRCELEELSGHPFMVMLTYSNDMIPRYTCSNGAVIKYADFKDLQNMFKRLRKSNSLGRKFRYLAVSERGKRGRPHFHLLIYLEKKDSDNQFDILNLERRLSDCFLNEWRRNVGSKRNPAYKPLCNYIEYFAYGKRQSNFGCHYVAPSSLDGSTIGASKYVSKYFLKRDEATQKLQQALRLNLDPEEYSKVWRIVKTRCLSSLNFGFGFYGDYNPRSVSKEDRLKLLSELPAFKHLEMSILRSVACQDSPKYYSLSDGKALPLSRYFYHIANLYTLPVYLHFKSKQCLTDDFVQLDDRDELYKLQLLDSKSRKLNKQTTDIIDFID